MAALAVSACDLAGPIDPVKTPKARPPGLNVPAVKPTKRAPPSAKSDELRAYYARVMNDRLTYGLLRRDGGGVDTPFTADMLLRNFERIAFFNEYVNEPGSGRGGSSPLRRWESPVRVEARFGASVPQSMRTRDSTALRSYSNRLARVTGHPISMSTDASANFHVFVVSEDDRPDAVQQILQLEPQIDRSILNAIANLGRNTYCIVVAFPRAENPYTYTRAIAIIRSEHPDLMRLSCIHEEVAQGLGLANDSPAARPSIFNDDDEFALLTTHDEALLSILYDPRLRPGISANEARPIVRQIANEKVGSAS
ncbi:MAG: DUF2927 domain-containing protein [Aliishimia sp.]